MGKGVTWFLKALLKCAHRSPKQEKCFWATRAHFLQRNVLSLQTWLQQGSKLLCFISRVSSRIQNDQSLVISSRMFVFFQKHTHVQICHAFFFIFNMCQTLLKTIWHTFRTIINTKSNMGSPASGLLRFFSSIFKLFTQEGK